MPMKTETAKKAMKEVVEGLQCILEAQQTLRSKRECVPVMKKPIHRFCEIAKKTERRFKKEDPHYEISRFLGAGSTERKKMGTVCSRKREFPNCDEAGRIGSKRWSSDEAWEEWAKHLDSCKRSIKQAIETQPIEGSQEWSKLIDSFETMRDWMHVSGYAVPDYVWVVPKRLRGKVKKVFEDMSSKKIRSSEDLKKLSKEIDDW